MTRRAAAGLVRRHRIAVRTIRFRLLGLVLAVLLPVETPARTPDGPSNPTHIPAASPSSRTKLLFSSGFAADTVLRPVDQRDCWAKGCWQDIAGADSDTGNYTGNATWPPDIWRGGARLQLIADVPVSAASIGSYMVNQIRTVTGHDGTRTRALYSEIMRGPDGRKPIGRAATQNAFQLLPVSEAGDLYMSFWLKFQPDLAQQMSDLPPGPGVNGGGTWRAFFEWKTGTPGQDDGDYRVAAYVLTYGGGTPYWAVSGDNVAGGGYPLVNNWSVENRSGVPVPEGAWFKFEAFWHRSSGTDGRIWMAVDGRVIADRHGANTGHRKLGINRIFWNLYSGGRLPIHQWVDDVQIWDGFPAAVAADPWYDPPYAPH